MTWLSIRIATVLLPLIVLGWQVLALERDLADHTVWRIPIVGFDPRDPIRGHYVRFRYDWSLSPSEIDRCEGLLADCRLCLHRTSSGALSTTVVLDGSPVDQCEALLIANPVPGREESSLLVGQRFYLDETLAKAADDVLRQQDGRTTEMEIAVSNSGRVRALRLYIGGQPLVGSE